MKKFNRIIAYSAFAIFAAEIHAGTVTFKDGTKISEAEIISIKDGKIVIRKDKKDHIFDLNKIESYFQTDFGGNSSLPGEFANYKVTIQDIKIPDSGRYSKGQKTKCIIKYTLTKTEADKHKIKAPYFYLFVLTTGDGDDERNVYDFCHPGDAKTKSKGYDEAAILKKIMGFDRKIINYKELDLEGLKNFGEKEIEFDMAGIGKRKIIAYHLEVWGNEKKIVEKNWKSLDHRVGELWWLRRE